jgi:hypothetical protein
MATKSEDFMSVGYNRQIQLSLILDHNPGRFAELCDLLYSRGVDIRAMNGTSNTDFAIMRVVVDQVKTAIEALEAEGIPFVQNEVLTVEVQNKPGMAAGLGHRLAQAGINIEYSYFSAGEAGTKALMVFRILDLDRALTVLNQPHGYN